MTVLEHSGRYTFDRCPVLGCPQGRDARVQLDLDSGQRRVATGCEKHISLLCAREVARARFIRGELPVALMED